MNRIFIVFILALSFHFSVQGQITWAKKTGPYGGYIGDIVVHPTNFTLYAVSNQYSNGGPLYRSSDNGVTWTELGTAVFSGDAGRFVDVLMLPNGTIYALSYYQCCGGTGGNDLYKSTDDGATWTKLNTGNGSAAGGFDNPTQVAYNSFSGTIYVIGRDNGSPFNYRVYRSINNGATFSKGFGDLSGDFTNISITSTGDVYAKHFSTLFKSTDDGTTFSNVGTPDLFSMTYLTAKSNGSELVMVTTGSTIYNLVSPFTTWNAVGETNITNATTYGNLAVLGYSLDNSTLYLQDNTNNKFYSGSTAGTWTAKSTTFVNSTGDNGICFAAKDANTLYVGTLDVGVWKSINAGSGWNESDNGIEAGNYQSILTATNGNIIVAGTRAQISTDQGATWTRITTIANNGPNYGLFKASTGSPAQIVAVSQSGSYKSTDNGSSWSATTSAPANTYNFASTDGTNIVAQGNNKFYYTHDQSLTWSAALTITGTGWPAGSYSVNQNYMAVDGTNGVIYCYLYDAGYKLFKIVLNSTTAPTTGTATLINQALIGSINQINSIAYLNGKVYVSWYGNSGPGNVSFSSDGGTTWTTTTGINSGRMDVDPINNYLFVTGSNGSTGYTINLTRDGGTNFTSSAITTTSSTFFYGINLSPSGIAYAGFTNSSIYATTNTVVTPAAPSSLINSGAGTTRLTLRWIDNATNESWFVIQKFNGTSYDSIGNLSSNPGTGAKLYYEVTGLQANTSYSFRVYAANAAGNSTAASITLSTINSCASTIPDNRSWNGSVAWSNVSPASGTTSLTNVSIKSLGSGYYSITDVANGAITGESTNIPAHFIESCNSTYLLPDYPIEPNTDGTWTSGTNTIVLKYITPVGVTSETTATVTLQVNPTDPIPAAPSNAAALVYNNSSIEVSWVGSAYETQYVVERSSVDNTFSTIDKTYTVNYPSTSVIDNFSLVTNTTYYYRVKAKNTTGTSAASNTASVQFIKPYFTLSGTVIESTTAYSTTGAVWGDFNNDGFDDVIMPQLTFFSSIPILPLAFKNDGAGNFISISPAGFVPDLYLVATAADYDNDGKLDLYLTSVGSQNYLYKGNGDFTFSLVSSTPVSTNDKANDNPVDLGASWADYNNDGLVDLFIVSNEITIPSRLYTQGPAGTFTKVTSGVISSILAEGSVGAWADFDNDGDQDIFINSQASSDVNRLYKNNGDGTFTKVTGAPFDTDLNEKTFTATWGDYNNDGFLDLFIGAQNNNLLYKNNGNGTFTKQSMPTTVTEAIGSVQVFGAAWGDVNNDGFIDLLASAPGVANLFYINNNGTSFTKVSTEKFNDSKNAKFGMAFSDYNKDGFLDLAAAVIDPSLFGGGFITGPSIKNLLFKNNTTSSANTNWVELKVTGTTSNKMGIGTRITLVAGGKTQIREITSSTGFCAQASQVVHFGLGSSSSITSIQIKWPSGIIQNITAPSILPINQILQFTEDGTPPAVTLLNPLNSATNVPLTTKIEMTFNENIYAVATKKINVFIQGSGSPAFSLDVTTGTITGNKISFTLASPLVQQTTYDLKVDAGAFTDQYGNGIAAITSGWVFVTHDTQAPVITYAPPATLDNGFSSTPLGVTISDNSGTVSTATWSYRKIGGGTFTDLAGTNGGSGTWNFTINESFFDGNGLEFYLSATDPDGNSARLPLDPNTTFYIYKNYPGASNAIPTAKLGFGGTASNWKIFTIPFDLGSSNAVSTVFDELSSLTIKTDWRMVTYNQVSKTWSDYPDFSTFTRGVGYFINIKTPLTLNAPTAAASSNNRKTLFQMNLKAGWNQIGNPYLTPINWSDVVTFNSLTGKAINLKTFSNGSYGAATSLAAWEGGFVFADNDINNVSIPFQGQTSIGGREISPITPVTFNNGDWIVPLTLTNGEIENKFGGVGMHSSASLAYDQFDDINAPRFIDYIEMNFPHPEDISKHFARDVVPLANEYTWEFTVDSNIKGLTELKWDNTSSVTKDIYLYDIKRETIVNMKDKASYSFDGKGSSLFRIYYGDNIEAKIKPETISLGDAYPNPSSSNKVTVPFTLPGNQSQYQVSLEVYDMLGQKVSTLVNGSLASGFYSVQWEPGQELNGGMYLYRIKVAGKDNSSVLSKKIIVNH